MQLTLYMYELWIAIESIHLQWIASESKIHSPIWNYMSNEHQPLVQLCVDKSGRNLQIGTHKLESIPVMETKPITKTKTRKNRKKTE